MSYAYPPPYLPHGQQGNPFDYQQPQPYNNYGNAYPGQPERNSEWTSYPMGNVHPMEVDDHRRDSGGRGVVLSENAKNCMIAVAVASFLIFIILWIS